MKKLLCVILMVAVCSFAACKKAEEKSPAQGKQQVDRQAQNKKKQKRAKGSGPQALQIYQEDKLIVAIPREEYATMMTTTVKVDGKDQKAILLSDLLKKHNVTGKNVALRGPNRVSNITWEQASTTPIYIYPVKNRLQIFHESKELQDSKIPIILVRIDVVEKPVAGAAKKGPKKAAP